MNYVFYYSSPIGNMILSSDGTYLTGLCFAERTCLADASVHRLKDLPVFKQTVRWLDIYFSGRGPNFTPPLKIQTTPFRKQVWEILLQIPYGQTTTYGKIAVQITKMRGEQKMAAQAVGGAVGHNPIALIIPCHRVIGADGSLTGYAGGISKKNKLLALEKAIIEE